MQLVDMNANTIKLSFLLEVNPRQISLKSRYASVIVTLHWIYIEVILE
jgi:hypothetical protein